MLQEIMQLLMIALSVAEITLHKVRTKQRLQGQNCIIQKFQTFIERHY